VLIHEASHIFTDTFDVEHQICTGAATFCYGEQNAIKLAKEWLFGALNNADNVEYFYEEWTSR